MESHSSSRPQSDFMRVLSQTLLERKVTLGSSAFHECFYGLKVVWLIDVHLTVSTLPCFRASRSAFDAACTSKHANTFQGYYEIAKALLQDTTTIRSKFLRLIKSETTRLSHLDTLYYSLWIEGNADESYVEDYDSTLLPLVHSKSF